MELLVIIILAIPLIILCQVVDKEQKDKQKRKDDLFSYKTYNNRKK